MGRLQIINLRPLKDVLWEAQGGKCWLCERSMRFYGKMAPDQATLDHVWPKSIYGNLGDIGVTLLAHRRCNELRANPVPDDDAVRALVRVWRRVDQNWMAANLEMLEATLRTLETQRTRVAVLRLFAERAAA